MLTYSNFTKSRTIEGWPMGGSKRGIAKFYVEAKGGHERACRTTECNGKVSKPITTTYATTVCFADGSDGKTYQLEITKHYNFVSVRQSNLKYGEETIHESEQPERYAELVAAIKAAT